MGTHQLLSYCKLCTKVQPAGFVDMGKNDVKFICPMCETKHYGPPVIEKRRNFVCYRCKEATPQKTWKRIKMAKDEVIHGPGTVCDGCNDKLKNGVVALVEIEDGSSGDESPTGRIFFSKPPPEFAKIIGEAKIVYIEESMLRKMRGKK